MMEERIKAKLNYLREMSDKYNKLNRITKNKYDWREKDINVQIEALENVIDNINNEYDECYEEDLKQK